jgi:hypothetical protein
VVHSFADLENERILTIIGQLDYVEIGDGIEAQNELNGI